MTDKEFYERIIMEINTPLIIYGNKTMLEFLCDEPKKIKYVLAALRRVYQ